MVNPWPTSEATYRLFLHTRPGDFCVSFCGCSLAEGEQRPVHWAGVNCQRVTPGACLRSPTKEGGGGQARPQLPRPRWAHGFYQRWGLPVGRLPAEAHAHSRTLIGFLPFCVAPPDPPARASRGGVPEKPPAQDPVLEPPLGSQMKLRFDPALPGEALTTLRFLGLWKPAGARPELRAAGPRSWVFVASTPDFSVAWRTVTGCRKQMPKLPLALEQAVG